MEAKNRLGELLDAAQRGPVTIEKHGRPVAVMVSAQDYQDLETLKLTSLRTEIRKGLDDIEGLGRTRTAMPLFRPSGNGLKGDTICSFPTKPWPI